MMKGCGIEAEILFYDPIKGIKKIVANSPNKC
jgi:hypothetical protein